MIFKTGRDDPYIMPQGTEHHDHSTSKDETKPRTGCKIYEISLRTEIRVKLL